MEQKQVIIIAVALIGMLLLGYGFYGFFVVRGKTGLGENVVCPFGFNGGLFSTTDKVFGGSVDTATCSYSLESIIIGGIALTVLVSTLLKKDVRPAQQDTAAQPAEQGTA